MLKKVAIFLFVALAMPVSVYSAEDNHAQCSDATFESIKGTETEVTYKVEAGFVVDGVCVKAGSDNQDAGHMGPYLEDFDNGCYKVVGIGTDTITVTKVGDGKECKDISHIDVYQVEKEDEDPQDPETPTTPEVPVQYTPEGGGRPYVPSVHVPVNTGDGLAVAGFNLVSLSLGLIALTAAFIIYPKGKKLMSESR